MMLRVRFWVSVVVITICTIGCISYFVFTAPDIKTFSSVRSAFETSDLVLLDVDGNVLHQMRQNQRERVFSWTPLNEISQALQKAIIKSEDKNFYIHKGVDYRALAASFYQRLFKDSPRGGSTISMQVVKLLSPGKSIYKSWSGKLRQVLDAGRLEKQWTKEQILEAYLNLVPFRGEYKGISSATWSLFQKNPESVTFTEGTLLGVLIRSPNAPLNDWILRACRQEPLSCDDFKRILSELRVDVSLPQNRQKALHLALRLKKTQSHGFLRTSIRKNLQIFIEDEVQSQIKSLESQNVRDAAVLVIENQTGEVWAYVGNTGLHSETKYVDGIQAFRQAGSTLKPFLYALAFEKNILHANSWLEDSAVDIVFDRGVYKPLNHDRQFYGWVSAKTALASSLNVPAVKVYRLLNDLSFWEKLKALHFRDLQDAEFYGPALALGVADVTLEDLTQAFRVLAVGGQYSSLSFVPSRATPQWNRVFSEESVKEVSQILSENQNRSLGFGMDSALSVPGTSVKTGTSKDMRDNWCVGFSSRFTVGVWVGNFNGEPMWNVMGVTGAAPLWKKVIEKLGADYPATRNLSRPGAEALAASQPMTYPKVRILYPQDGMVLALDPSMPMKQQKVPLMVQGEELKNYYWKINGSKKVSARTPFLWTPQEGRHKFELYHNEELKETVQVLVK